MLIFTVFIAISELFATFPKMKFREYTMFLGNRRFRQKGKSVFNCYGVAFFYLDLVKIAQSRINTAVKG
jgi:hypothetical protein